ncbi:hypothetical protein [Vibrio tritonius]|uniref:hypothetical protein n=1 Tax=Vibrio tritonius TaxID=1435069 RepID=UPI00315CDD83
MAYKGVLLANEEKEIEEKIKNEETLFSWETTIWSYIHGNSNKYLRVIATFSPLITGFLLVFFHSITSDVVMTKKEMLTTSGAMSIGMLFFCLLMRVYVVSDIKCTFILKKSGIIIKKKRILSDLSISFVRFIGWSGVVICLLAIIYVGPIAFAGAGIFALSTLKMVNYKSQERETIVIIIDKVLFFNFEKKKIITVMPHPYRIPHDIYYDKLEENIIIDKLKHIYNVVGIYKVENDTECLKHAATLEAAKVNQDIINEMRSLGMDV